MDRMGFLERFEGLKKYIKYIIILIIIIVLLLVFKGCGGSNYSSLERKVEEAAIEYIKQNKIVLQGENYVELSYLKSIEGTEYCSKASGAIVKNNNGNIEAQAYLKCEDYTTVIYKNNSKYISLNGNDVILLNMGEAFNDPLYETKKDCNVVVNGYVGTEPGVYTLKYSVYVNNKSVDTLYRKVIISKVDTSSTISGVDSLTNPTITLNGSSEITIYRNEKLTEPGYTAIDYVDGKISRKVLVEPKLSKINTSKVGTYKVVYSVTNSRGNMAIATRTINVIDRNIDIYITLEKMDNNISNEAKLLITVTGNDYAYMNVPFSSKKEYASNYEYTAKSNGRYSFKVYDRYGNMYVKEIEVDNIDTIAPTGSCKAVVSSKATTVSVNATDNKGIAGYKYIIDGKEGSYITKNEYQSSGKATTVSVKVKDIAENETTLSCEIEKKTIITADGSCKSGDVYITINTCYLDQTIRKNVPLEEYLVGVLYGEMGTGYRNEDLLKAFVIFARTFTLNRIRYWDGKSNPLRSCSSDQNWCDLDSGCYRDQTQEMFDACIDYAIAYSRNDYTAATCANRVTTFPGQKDVSNKTFYVNNPNWTKEMSVTSTSVNPSWKKPISASDRAFLKRMVDETAGLIIYKSENESAGVGYYICGSSGPDNNKNVMCVDDAIKKSSQGYTMEELIEAYTQLNKNRTVDCYNK